MMVKNKFGLAGHNVVIEERLFGEEASFIAICDGKTIMPLASSKDHKRIFDNDQGPNTGGMGSYSPAPLIDSELYGKIIKEVMEPTVRGMSKRGQPIKGFIYAGIMVDTARKRAVRLGIQRKNGRPRMPTHNDETKVRSFRIFAVGG